MVREMPARVYYGWRKFHALEPFGPRQEDLRSGHIASILASVNRDKHVHPGAYDPDEFFHSLVEIPPTIVPTAPVKKTPGRMLQTMEAMFLTKSSEHRKQRPRYEDEKKDS